MTAEEDGVVLHMGETLFEHLWELWVGPEVTARELDVTPDSVRKIVIEIPPGGPIAVRLDDEAIIRLGVVSTRAIQAGEDITEADFSEVRSMEPANVDANSGWVCFARLPSGEAYVAFDFTYNRERALLLLSRAEEFMASAQRSRETSLSVCLDSAFSAAELAVQAEMLVMQEETRNHKVRGKWLEEWAKLGNAPKEHADTLWLLGDLRKKGRYEHAPVRVSSERLKQLLDVVEGMIERSRTRMDSIEDRSDGTS